MNFGFAKVGTYVPSVRVADTEYNAESIIEGIKEAKNLNLEILVFPELCVTGATCGDLFRSDTLLESAKLAVKRVVDYTAKDVKMLVAIGLPFKWNGKLFDVACMICHGKILALIPKTNVLGYGSDYSRRIFGGAEEKTAYVDFLGEQVPFGTDIILTSMRNKLRVVVEIGTDLSVPNSPSDRHTLNGANLILNLCAVPEIVGLDESVVQSVSAKTRSNVCAYVLVNAGEGESTTDAVYGGYTVIAENGKVITEKKAFNTGLTYTEVDLDFLEFENPNLLNGISSVGYENYVKIPFEIEGTGMLSRKFSKTPFVPTNPEELKYRAEKIFEIQAHGLKKRMEHTGAKKLVVGLSGGLDSTLAALVCVRTMELLGKPTSNVIACTMPCFGTSERTLDNSVKLANALKITLKTVDITNATETHLKDIGHDLKTFDTAYENAQARERTQVLMDIANMENGLVIGTGDMSELALGWSTYNGDQMSMYAVNSSITKTLAKALVGYVASTKSDEIKDILTDILDTPVSPELLPKKDGKGIQKTEDLIGPYVLHDFYLYHFLRRGNSPKKVYYITRNTFNDEYTDKEMLKWLRVFVTRFFSQQFKRSCSPDGVKVGSLDLSPRGSLKMPSDAVATAWMNELDRVWDINSTLFGENY